MANCLPEFEYFLLYSRKIETLFPKLEYQKLQTMQLLNQLTYK